MRNFSPIFLLIFSPVIDAAAGTNRIKGDSHSTTPPVIAIRGDLSPPANIDIGPSLVQSAAPADDLTLLPLAEPMNPLTPATIAAGLSPTTFRAAPAREDIGVPASSASEERRPSAPFQQAASIVHGLSEDSSAAMALEKAFDGSAQFSDNDSRNMIDQLLAQPFVDASYSKPILQGLRPVADRAELERALSVRLENLSELEREFDFTNETGRHVRVKLLALESTAVSVPNLTVVGVLFAAGKSDPVGFFMSRLLKDAAQRLISVDPYMKRDMRAPEVKGIGDMYFSYYTRLLKGLGVHEQKAELGWVGRAKWLGKGYVFDSATTMHEDGAEISQVELIRRNLRRFLAFHGVAERDLAIQRSGGLEPLKSIEHLSTPEDFRFLQHREGKKIRIAPYVDDGKLGEEMDMDLGLAFTLADYRLYLGQRVSIRLGEKPLSDQAMPTWIGVRKIGVGLP